MTTARGRIFGKLAAFMVWVLWTVAVTMALEFAIWRWLGTHDAREARQLLPAKCAQLRTGMTRTEAMSTMHAGYTPPQESEVVGQALLVSSAICCRCTVQFRSDGRVLTSVYSQNPAYQP